jgi:starch phosphorylase
MQTAPKLAFDNVSCDLSRTGMSVDDLKRSFLDNLFYVLGKFPALATQNDYYLALAYAIRDRLVQRLYQKRIPNRLLFVR